MEFSTRTIHHLIKGQGERRVSEPAADELTEILERFAGDLAEEAVGLASDDGYQTVKRDHVRNALEQ